MHKLLRAFALMMAVMLAVFMVGCGDDDDDDDDTGDGAVTFTGANPAAGSTIPGNATITLNFSGPPGTVTVNGAAATVAGNSATWTGNLPAGAATLNVAWTAGGGGTATVNYTVTVPDVDPPTISGSTVDDGAKDVDPADVGEAFEVTFSEDVQRGTAVIETDAGENLNWLPTWEARKVTLEKGAAGKAVGNETTYVVTIKTKDAAGNALDTTITFVTAPKDQG
jgi:hypothetical protein